MRQRGRKGRPTTCWNKSRQEMQNPNRFLFYFICYTWIIKNPHPSRGNTFFSSTKNPDNLWGQCSLLLSGYSGSFIGWIYRYLTLTSYLHLLRLARVSGAILLLSLYAFIAKTGETLSLYVTILRSGENRCLLLRIILLAGDIRTLRILLLVKQARQRHIPENCTSYDTSPSKQHKDTQSVSR
jgi:hypothetical protein